MDATIVRPRRKDEPGHGPHLAPIRQRIEWIFWTCKRHSSPSNATAPAPSTASENASCNASSPSPPRVTLNHQLGRPSRALVDYCA